jgi:FkbM family methyltransferase
MQIARFPRALVVPLTRRFKWGAHRIGHALGNRVLIGKTPGGSAIALSMRDHQHRQIYFYDSYEPKIEAVFRRLVKPGSTVFDVGANAGFFSVLSAELGAEVHAFEPNPAVQELLQTTASLGGQITVSRCACGAETGTMTLYVSNAGETGSSGVMVALDRESVQVGVITLDEYSEDHGVYPQIVKIDVEGAEADVLRGMHQILRRDRPTLIIELHVIKGPVEHATHGEVCTLLSDADYDYQLIDSNKPRDDGGPVRENILATPRPVAG